MKIAQIAPLIERIPPKKYGGTERIVHTLTEELVKRGHDVTLFASGDSKTSAKLIPTSPKSFRELAPSDSKKWFLDTLKHLGTAYGMSEEFDIIHDHTSFYGASYANCVNTPTVITLHGALTKEAIDAFSIYPKPHLVTISNAQRQPEPNLNYIGNVYNGLDMTSYPFSSSNDGYLLNVGRICAEKGTGIAIQVALKLDMLLIIAAKLEPHINGEYFEKEVKPYLGGKIRWIGEVSEKERNKLYANALCLLHPVTWPEPFGLTLIEAMACGCPVIGLNLGSIPEVISHGKTGFVAKDTADMVKFVHKIGKINRFMCRSRVLKKFNARQMTEDYEYIYYQILQQKVITNPAYIQEFNQNYLP
jgi:glycosyltransferase involved in cell wall biosynthesis